MLAVELGLLVSSGSRSEVDASLDGRCRLVLPPGSFLLPDLAPSLVLEVGQGPGEIPGSSRQPRRRRRLWAPPPSLEALLRYSSLPSRPSTNPGEIPNPLD